MYLHKSKGGGGAHVEANMFPSDDDADDDADELLPSSPPPEDIIESSLSGSDYSESQQAIKAAKVSLVLHLGQDDERDDQHTCPPALPA